MGTTRPMLSGADEHGGEGPAAGVEASRRFFTAMRQSIPGSGVKWQRRTRSWSPKQLAEAALCGAFPHEETLPAAENGDAAILFDSCQIPRPPARDLLDVVLAAEPWQEVETDAGKQVRIVGEADALRRLLSLPLRSPGEAVCCHRVGDCLVVVDADGDGADPEDGYELLDPRLAIASSLGGLEESPRTTVAERCQVRWEGDMVRVYPSMEPATAVADVGPAPGRLAVPTDTCSQLRVREGLSLTAGASVPSVVPTHGVAGNRSRAATFDTLEGLRGAPPQLMRTGYSSGDAQSQRRKLRMEPPATVEEGLLRTPQRRAPSLPAYERQPVGDQVAVFVVPLADLLETQAVVDAWLSCFLLGAPSLLCFFVDGEGVCRGCRFVPPAQIPRLSALAQNYRAGLLCLKPHPDKMQGCESPPVTEEQYGSMSQAAFEPHAIREAASSLLETLVSHCDKEGGHCIVMAGQLGSLRLVGTSPPPISRLPSAPCQKSGDLEEDAEYVAENWTLALVTPAPGSNFKPGEGRPLPAAATPDASVADLSVMSEGANRRLRRNHMTQALLMYHAAVRLAQARGPAAASCGNGDAKSVPVGSRWTTKSCQHPLRVRQMMLSAIRALRAAVSIAEKGGDQSGETGGAAPEVHPRYLLLVASASEFLADSFLAERVQAETPEETLQLDAARHTAALRHLRTSCQHLADYADTAQIDGPGEDFSRSVRRLEERLLAKRTNAHMGLARIRQRQPWKSGASDLSPPSIAQALQELETAEGLVARPPYATLPTSRSQGLYERSLLASISKWKGDLMFQLACLCSGPSHAGANVVDSLPLACPPATAEPEPPHREYLEAQQREIGESPQPPLAQQERWLQSTISFALRSLHQMAGLPEEVVEDLQKQGRCLLARAYGDLGQVYASTGRYTKAMTHAKQGIELFNATKDKMHALILQLWICRLQLRMALPPCPTGSTSLGGTYGSSAALEQHDAALLCGLSTVSGTEDAACTQVALTIQKAMKGLDENVAEEKQVLKDAQGLLGKVWLRQGLARLAAVSTSSSSSGATAAGATGGGGNNGSPASGLSGAIAAVCRLFEEEQTLPSIIELLQNAEQAAAGSGGAGVDLSPDAPAREAVDYLLRAAESLAEARDGLLAGTAHACTAAVYFCGQDVRIQRLVPTHCQHARDYLQDCLSPESSESSIPGRPDAAAVRLAVQLLDAKALRRGTGGGSGASRAGASAATHAAASSQAWSDRGDVRSAALLCDIAVSCLRSPSSPRKSSAGVGEAPPPPSSPDDASSVSSPLGVDSACVGDASADRSLLGWLPARALLHDEQRLPLMSYLKQEIGDTLLRLLRNQGGASTQQGRELKALYCSLLTAWHGEAGQVEALSVLRSYLRGEHLTKCVGDESVLTDHVAG
eukprot:TRINITY_DN15210_c0_g1_i1.p1 TRINITY_DN15210_c0_g1~~TRINITY_DN15210_c0_g1_i1.p1  ORF type:complete len:1418 (-),score=288.58 TRINITY_DN15210_c0_g1_i1:278-4471(-)